VTGPEEELGQEPEQEERHIEEARRDPSERERLGPVHGDAAPAADAPPRPQCREACRDDHGRQERGLDVGPRVQRQPEDLMAAANGSNSWGAPELEDEIAQDQIGAPGQGGTEQAEPQGDGARADRIDPPAVSQPGLRAFPLRRSRRGHFGLSIQCQKWGER